MFKKITALTLTALFLTMSAFATVTSPVILAQASEEITGETKTYNVWNTSDGTSEKGGTKDACDELYETVRYYTSTSTGRNSNKNQGASPFLQVGYATYNFASLMRFPLDLEIPENETIIKAELSLTSTTDQTVQDGGFALGVYDAGITTEFGNTIDVSKTFADLTATSISSVNVTSLAQYDTVKIDVTAYVKGLISSDAASADLAIAAPDATAAFYRFYSMCNDNITTPTYFPHLEITTVVDETMGIPAIDTVAMEGKTKIRMQTQKDIAFANNSCGIISGNKVTASYDVNCKTAGKYYFSVYTTDRYKNTKSRGGKLIVNGVETSVTFVQSGNVGYESEVVPALVVDTLYRNTFEVDLVAGKNTIEIVSASLYLAFAYVELTNYARAVIGTDRVISEKGIEVQDTVQPTVTNYPTVVYKVYDSLADVSAAKANVTMQVSGEGTAIESCHYLAVSYDEDDCLKDVNLITLPLKSKVARNIDMGEFALDGVSYIKVFVFDGTTLVPVTTWGTIE